MEAVLLVGIQGAGKSTFYLRRFFDTHVRINLDMLKTRYRTQVFLQACILAKQPFVVDNTNVLVVERETYIAPARAAGKKKIPVPAILGTRKRLQPPPARKGSIISFLG